MARDDDDERPRKRRPRDDDDEEEDRPRKRRVRDDDDDDVEEDDRPRRRRSRDEDEDEDDEENRPRKSRRSHDDEDDEEEEEDERPSRKKNKKKKKPMPGMLLAVSIVNIVWGGLATLYGLVNLFSAVSDLLSLMNAQQIFNVGIVGLTRGFLISLVVLHFLILIVSIGILGGGVALILRKGFGKYLALGCPIGKVIICLIGIVLIVVFLRGTIFLMGFICVFIGMMIFDLCVGIFNFIALANDSVKRALD